MKRIIKKLTAIAMCGALTVGSAVIANAADTSDENDKVKVTGSYELGNGKIATGAYNLDEENRVRAIVTNKNDNSKSYTMDLFSLGNNIKTYDMPLDGKYSFMYISRTGGGGDATGFKIFDENISGSYSKVRVKLHDIYPDYFTEKGTVIKKSRYNNMQWEYNFKYQSYDNGHFSSDLVFRSGAFITGCAPDEDGYVELYLCNNIGVKTDMSTSFGYDFPRVAGSDGGTSSTTVSQFTVGDTNGDHIIDIKDATDVQKYIVSLESFDGFQKFVADVNHDGEINIVDATLIQKYIVGLDK